MTAKKKTLFVLMIFVLIYLLSIVAIKSEEIGFCAQNSLCSNNFFYALGRPLFKLFSFLLPFTLLLSLFKEDALRYWLPKVLWTLPIPIVLTFLTPMNCSGFLGCIPSREQTAWITGALYVGIFVFAIALRAIRNRSQKPQV